VESYMLMKLLNYIYLYSFLITANKNIYNAEI